MAKKGPKGLTNAQKKARGTAQPCRKDNVIRAFDFVATKAELPEPPDWFLHLEDEWKARKYAVALDTFITNRDRLFAEGRLCQRHVDGLSNLAVLQAQFFVAACNEGGVPSSLVAQITTLQTRLGILPDGKETTAPMAPEKNKFSGNGANRSR